MFGGLTPAAAGAGDATPHLVMPDPDGHKGSIISGSITTGVHVAILLLIAWLGWNAEPIQQLIEVKIIRELPGADEEPAPARKKLKPRKRTPVQRAPQQVAAQAVEQPRVIQMTAEQHRMAQVQQAIAPAEVRRRQITSTRAQARSIDTRRASAIDLTQFDQVQIVEGLAAPTIPDYSGPRKVSQMKAPQVVTAPTVRNVEYSSAAPLEVISDGDAGEDMEAFEFDSDVGVYAGGEGTGGTGTALGVVSCFESAFVQRYLAVLEERMEKRWQAPEGTPDDAAVVLKFMLDSSGAATDVQFRGDTPAALGNSAVAAMRAASPFPPMDDNVRCLSGKKLSGKFSFDNL